MVSRKKPRRVAVFDIDGTIFRSSLLIELVEGLIAQGIFKASARHGYERAYQNWLNRKDGYEKYIWAVVKTFEMNLRGVSEKDFKKVIRGVIAREQERVYRYTRDLVKELKRRGYFLLAISHSPKYVAHLFAQKLGFNKVYGRYLELDSRGRFTGGELYANLIYDKAKILRRAVRKENLTLAGSVGVGDTESDIPFLRLVSKPICFNPNSALYRVARTRGWQIVVERKDVIYKIPQA